MSRKCVGRGVMRRGAVVLLLAGAVLCAPPAAVGQIELGVIQGIVTDEADEPLEGVSLRIRDTGRGREFTLTSDKDGRFYRRGLPAVEYEMTVQKDGYKSIQDKVRLNAGVDRRFSFKLAREAAEGAAEFTTGVAAFNAGDNAAAAKAFEAAMLKAPSLPEIHVNLAMAYLRLGRAAEAVTQLEQATVLGAGAADVQFQLGGAYVELKALDKAAAAFEAGFAIQPALTDPMAIDAAITLGAVYFATGQNDKAAAQFAKVLTVRPDDPAASLGLAKVHFSKGDVEKALALFDRIVAASPGTPEAAQAAAFAAELRKGGAPAGTAQAAGVAATRLSVLSAGAVEEGVLRLARQYKQEVGPDAALRFGTAPEVEKHLASGEPADVLIAPEAVIERALKSGAVVAGTEMRVASVGVGVTVRHGAPAPDISTTAALRATLLATDSVVYNEASTGRYLESLFGRMGIGDQLKPKTTRYANAAQVIEHVIAGQGNEIGFGPITEIKSFEPKGAVLVGPLPDDLQNYTTYVAAVTTRAVSPDAGRAFIRHLTSAASRRVFLETGAR